MIDDIDPDAFWAKVDRTGGPDACWPWMDVRIGDGDYENKYGVHYRKGRSYRAHRVAYELVTGVDPGALMVCHSCDYPPCCNPAHHWLGTAADNNRDKNRKGRTRLPRQRLEEHLCEACGYTHSGDCALSLRAKWAAAGAHEGEQA